MTNHELKNTLMEKIAEILEICQNADDEETGEFWYNQFLIDAESIRMVQVREEIKELTGEI